MPSSEGALQRASLVLRLRSMGITDHRLVSAFEATPRALFAPEAYAADAYADRLIPIGCGQTMEAPSVLARLLQNVAVDDTMSVLDVGTGSGYFAALLGRLARRVISVERFRSLAHDARAKLNQAGLSNVECLLADGLVGWEKAAPFHAIFVTGSVDSLPSAWLSQLAPRGTLIAPVGPAGSQQTWIAFSKDADGKIDQNVIGTAFAIPLEPGLARVL